MMNFIRHKSVFDTHLPNYCFRMYSKSSETMEELVVIISTWYYLIVVVNKYLVLFNCFL